MTSVKLTVLLATGAACRDVLARYGCYVQSEGVWGGAPSDTASSADQVFCTSNRKKEERIMVSA